MAQRKFGAEPSLEAILLMRSLRSAPTVHDLWSTGAHKVRDHRRDAVDELVSQLLQADRTRAGGPEADEESFQLIPLEQFHAAQIQLLQAQVDELVRQAHEFRTELAALRGGDPAADTPIDLGTVAEKECAIRDAFATAFGVDASVIDVTTVSGEEGVHVVLDATRADPIAIAAARSAGRRVEFFENLGAAVDASILDAIAFDFVFPDDQ
jgi:hypothetical protein